MNNADTSIYNTGLTQEEMEGFGNKFHQGLTKREHFAAIAMQGWLARCSTVPHTYKLDPSDIAEVAVSMADALLKELNK